VGFIFSFTLSQRQSSDHTADPVYVPFMKPYVRYQNKLHKGSTGSSQHNNSWATDKFGSK
jgi:hypothetical protein